LLASLPNFEQAYFDMEVSKEKPYNAITILSQEESKFQVLKMLLDALLDHEKALPNRCSEWKNLPALEAEVNALLVKS
jgi:putative ATP-dependent endonuclease of OLD family